MRPLNAVSLGLVLAATTATSFAAEDPYRVAGEVAVQHEGRVKPLDTFARLVVKQIYTREDIKLVDADGKVVGRWSPLPAFLDWQARPDFWNEQEIIAVEYPPLRQKLLASPAKEAMKALADSGKLSAEDKARVLKSADDPTWADLKAAASLNGVPAELKARLKLLSHKLHPDQKWLAPDDIEDAQLIADDGHEVDFRGWVEHAQRDAREKAGDLGRPELPAMEKKAAEVFERLIKYQSFRDGNTAGYDGYDLFVTPRPIGTAYLKFTADAMDKVIAAQKDKHESVQQSDFSPLEQDVLNVWQFYTKDIKSTAVHLPGTNAEFDAKFTEWLREKSFWVPLRTLRQSKPDELTRIGFDPKKVESLVKAYDTAIAAEKANPRKLPAAAAQALASAARSLGESTTLVYLQKGDPGHKLWADFSASRVAAFDAVRKGMSESSAGPSEEQASKLLAAARSIHPSMVPYPSTPEMQRELTYNYQAPFYKAPMAYAVALVVLLLSLGAAGAPGTTSHKIERGLYGIGMAAFALGIALEIYGFYFRVRITGWAPVTNMYETVIWVALVTAGLGMIMELIYRKTYAAVAASGVSLLATLLAANVSLLDPKIGSLAPVLRSNYWLTIHVLTIVSSYAAFALAMGLGLLGIAYYLSATYRRDVPYAKLAMPLIPSLPMLAIGVGGLITAGSKPLSPVSGVALGSVAMIGLLGTIFGLFALIGELCNRASSKAMGLGLALLVVGVAGMFGVGYLTTPTWWPDTIGLIAAPTIAVGLGLSVLLLSRMGAAARSALVEGVAKIEAPELAELSRPRAVNHESAAGGGSVMTMAKPTVAEIRAMQEASRPPTDPRTLAMQATAAKIKPLSNFTYRAMQVGVLLVAAGTILGGVWADVSWGRFWGWDAKEVWALITLLVYLIPLHGRFAGWVNTFTLTSAAVICFASVLMAWYGVNFVLATGLHSYGFSEGGGQGVVLTASLSVVAIVAATAWRRNLASYRPLV